MLAQQKLARFVPMGIMLPTMLDQAIRVSVYFIAALALEHLALLLENLDGLGGGGHLSDGVSGGDLDVVECEDEVG